MGEANAIIDRLQLSPHPEGGWYRETWRGEGTAILFLLEEGQRSHWHRIKGTELWIFQAGSPLLLKLATGDDGEGRYSETLLGTKVSAGQAPQQIVQPWQWQAAEACRGWSMVTCVVVPPFEFEGFQLAPPNWRPLAQPL